jgi:hypothetical protein
MSNIVRAATAALYLLCIVAANYAIQHIGNAPAFPGGPYTLPVGFGLAAPSGVYLIGIILVLRDVVQRQSGKAATVALIVAATVLTYFLSPTLAVASGIAFLASESIDFSVFTFLEKRTYLGAVLASNAVSLVVDSVVFLAWAFHSLDYVQGQVVGKIIGTLAAFAVLAVLEALRNRTQPQTFRIYAPGRD